MSSKKNKIQPIDNSKPKMLISFSGGRTSAFMTHWLLNNKPDEYDFIVVFANTGKEREETLQFVHDCDTHFNFKTIWIEAVVNPEFRKGTTARIVTFETASRNGEPFEDVIKKYGIPNMSNPHCTRELKKYAIRNFAKSLGWKKYETAIGIRNDEIDRISSAKDVERLSYPLISMIPSTKQDVWNFWSKQSFDLQLKGYEGNCDCCWKKSLRKLMTIAVETPEKFEWWNEMEEKYESYAPASKPSMLRKIADGELMRFNRREMPVNEIIELSKTEKFEMATDDTKFENADEKQKTKGGIDLDLSNGCVESCEVF